MVSNFYVVARKLLHTSRRAVSTRSTFQGSRRAVSPGHPKKQLPCSENDPGHPKKRWPVHKKRPWHPKKKQPYRINHPGHPKKYSPVTKTTLSIQKALFVRPEECFADTQSRMGGMFCGCPGDYMRQDKSFWMPKGRFCDGGSYFWLPM